MQLARTVRLFLLVLLLGVFAAPLAAQDDAETTDEEVAKEFDIMKVVESEEMNLVCETEREIEKEMEAFEAAELAAGDKETFEKFFANIGMNSPKMLDRNQTLYALILNDVFCRSGLNTIFGDDNYVTFYWCCMYTFLCAEFQGVDFSKISEMYERPIPGKSGKPRFGFITTSDKTAEFNHNFATLTRYRAILETVSTNLGRFALARNQPTMSGDYFKRELRDQLEAWKSQRGMLVSDVLFVWLLARQPGYFKVPKVRGWQDEEKIHYDVKVPEGIFANKTTPNLAFNNKVAELISRKLNWEEVKKETGMTGSGLNDWLAGVIWEHGETIKMIPLIGSVLCAAECACDAFDSKLSGSARAAAVGMFFVNFALAVTDVFLVKAVAVMAGELVLNTAKLAVSSSRAAGSAIKNFATELNAQLRLFRFNAASAQSLRELIRIQLKWLRNRLMGAPKAIAEAARKAALEYAEQMAKLGKTTRPSKVTAAVNRKTGETVLGRSSKGIGREGVKVHPRMEAIEKQVMEFTKGEGLERHPFKGCSEWDAINQALNKGWDIEDLVLRTLFTKKSAFGTFAQPCRNCRVSVFGAVIVF